MSSATGRESEFAVKKATTWKTAVACGAGDGALFLSETVEKKQEIHVDDSLQEWPVTSDQGAITVDGDIECYARYDDIPQHRMIALACGTAGSPVSAAAGVYTNTYGLADTLDGLFATLAFYRVIDVKEIPTAKIDGFTITGEAGQPIKITFHVIGDTRNVNTGSSGTNNPDSSWTSVTIVERDNRLMFSDLAVWINDASGVALSSGDAIYPNGFTLTYRRNTAGDQTADGDDLIDEPMGGVPECTLNMTFPKHTTAAIANFTDFDASTPKKAQLAFTGAEITAGYNYEFNVLLPNLVINEAASTISGPDKIPHALTFTCLGRENAPTGMTGLNEPFEIQVQNTMATSPIA